MCQRKEAQCKPLALLLERKNDSILIKFQFFILPYKLLALLVEKTSNL